MSGWPQLQAEGVLVRLRAPAAGDEPALVEMATNDMVGSGSLACKRGPLELSLQLGHRCWGRGYALEAVLLIRDWFFKHTSEDLLIATTQHANEACRRLLQRAGGHLASTFEQYQLPQELYEFTRGTPRPQPPGAATPRSHR